MKVSELLNEESKVRISQKSFPVTDKFMNDPVIL